MKHPFTCGAIFGTLYAAFMWLANGLPIIAPAIAGMCLIPAGLWIDHRARKRGRI